MSADLLLGYVSFAPGMLGIKACVALIAGGIFNHFGRGQATGRAFGVQLIGGVAAEAFMVLSYFFYEVVLLCVSIACENIALAAQELGLGSVIVGLPKKVFLSDRGAHYCAKFGFPEGYCFSIAIAIGNNTVTKEAHPIGEGKVNLVL